MNIKIHACVGGTAVRDDIRTLQDGVHVVVGTPGRVYDMIQRRALRLDSVQLFVLDEGKKLIEALYTFLIDFYFLRPCQSFFPSLSVFVGIFTYISFPLLFVILSFFSSSLTHSFFLAPFLFFSHTLLNSLYLSLPVSHTLSPFPYS